MRYLYDVFVVLCMHVLYLHVHVDVVQGGYTVHTTSIVLRSVILLKYNGY